MILTDIPHCGRYDGLSPLIAMALKYVREFDAGAFVRGETVLTHPDYADAPVIVRAEETALLPREKVSLETHRRFIDIHVPVKGPETIGWAPADKLKLGRAEYDAGTDIRYFGDTADSLLHVKVGQVAVFFPEDVHAPNIGLGNHRKLCIKVPCL